MKKKLYNFWSIMHEFGMNRLMSCRMYYKDSENEYVKTRTYKFWRRFTNFTRNKKWKFF